MIVEGAAEVSTVRAGQQVPLASLGPGDFFGEAALLSSEGLRQATVTPTTDLAALSLDRDSFHRALDA